MTRPPGPLFTDAIVVILVFAVVFTTVAVALIALRGWPHVLMPETGP